MTRYFLKRYIWLAILMPALSYADVADKQTSLSQSEYRETSGFVTTKANQILHYIAGSRSGAQKPLLLFIHGAPERAEVWRDYMRKFSQDYFTVAYNSRGYYPSSIPTNTDDYTLEALAEDAVDVANFFGYDSFTVVGHDWGAATAWQVAIDFPDSVEKLVIFSNPHPIIYSRAYYESAQHRKLLNAYIPLARKDIAPWSREGTLANDLSHYKDYVYTPAAKDSIPWSLSMLLEETWTYDNGASIEAIYQHYKALSWPLLPIHSCNFFFFSVAVEQPVLLFYGEKDRFVGAEAFTLPYNNCNPNTWYVNFPNGDHFIHHVYKEEIFSDMEIFLGNE